MYCLSVDYIDEVWPCAVVQRILVHLWFFFNSFFAKIVLDELSFIFKRENELKLHPLFDLCFSFAFGASRSLCNVTFFEHDHQVWCFVSVIVAPYFEIIYIFDAAHLARSILFDIWDTTLFDWIKRWYFWISSFVVIEICLCTNFAFYLFKVDRVCTLIHVPVLQVELNLANFRVGKIDTASIEVGHSCGDHNAILNRKRVCSVIEVL